MKLYNKGISTFNNTFDANKIMLMLKQMAILKKKILKDKDKKIIKNHNFHIISLEEKKKATFEEDEDELQKKFDLSKT